MMIRREDDVVYLLWSFKHSAWWKPGDWGYTEDIGQAGRYGRNEAVERVVQSAQCGDVAQVTAMVAAPDNWEMEGS